MLINWVAHNCNNLPEEVNVLDKGEDNTKKQRISLRKQFQKICIKANVNQPSFNYCDKFSDEAELFAKGLYMKKTGESHHFF